MIVQIVNYYEGYFTVDEKYYQFLSKLVILYVKEVTYPVQTRFTYSGASKCKLYELEYSHWKDFREWCSKREILVFPKTKLFRYNGIFPSRVEIKFDEDNSDWVEFLLSN